MTWRLSPNITLSLGCGNLTHQALRYHLDSKSRDEPPRGWFWKELANTETLDPVGSSGAQCKESEMRRMSEERKMQEMSKVSEMQGMSKESKQPNNSMIQKPFW